MGILLKRRNFVYLLVTCTSCQQTVYQSWESVSFRDLLICTFGRDEYLHLTLIDTLQINMIIKSQIWRSNIIYYFANACVTSLQQNLPPPLSFLEEIFPFGKSRFPPFVFCQLAAARKRLSKRIEDA